MTRRIEFERNRRWDILAIVGVISFVALQSFWLSFKESRSYRDFMGITPFTDVVVYGTVAEPTGIIIQGEMVKVRCDYSAMVAYVKVKDGPRFRFPVDTSVEDGRGVSGNRHPSADAQGWGPWKIHYSGGLGRAEAWEIWVDHVKCPSKPTEQRNLFAAGDWETGQPVYTFSIFWAAFWFLIIVAVGVLIWARQRWLT